MCRRAPEITHLLFVDDSLLFFDTEEQAIRIEEGLMSYCRATGELINFDTCSILFNRNHDHNVMEQIPRQLDVHRPVFEAKYLGLPTPEGRLKNYRQVSQKGEFMG